MAPGGNPNFWWPWKCWWDLSRLCTKFWYAQNQPWKWPFYKQALRACRNSQIQKSFSLPLSFCLSLLIVSFSPSRLPLLSESVSFVMSSLFCLLCLNDLLTFFSGSLLLSPPLLRLSAAVSSWAPCFVKQCGSIQSLESARCSHWSLDQSIHPLASPTISNHLSRKDRACWQFSLGGGCHHDHVRHHALLGLEGS